MMVTMSPSRWTQPSRIGTTDDRLSSIAVSNADLSVPRCCGIAQAAAAARNSALSDAV
ncbi:MAG: hypothetical protein HY925_04380 [Elusimicrobia bacterium]|nr:hypothetical protein [Elusimicrobiota bacterium]